MDRVRHRWTAKIQSAETGETLVRSFESYWDPGKVSLESIAVAAAAQESVKTKVKHVGIAASLLTAA